MMSQKIIFQIPCEPILMDHNNILLQKYPVLLYSCKKLWGAQSFNQFFPDYKHLLLHINAPGLSLIQQY
jgi:hypothetical protein